MMITGFGLGAQNYGNVTKVEPASAVKDQVVKEEPSTSSPLTLPPGLENMSPAQKKAGTDMVRLINLNNAFELTSRTSKVSHKQNKRYPLENDM